MVNMEDDFKKLESVLLRPEIIVETNQSQRSNNKVTKQETFSTFGESVIIKRSVSQNENYNDPKMPSIKAMSGCLSEENIHATGLTGILNNQSQGQSFVMNFGPIMTTQDIEKAAGMKKRFPRPNENHYDRRFSQQRSSKTGIQVKAT